MRTGDRDIEFVTLEAVPLASERATGARIGLVRPKRSRLLRLLADSDLDWRADACTQLLKRGWREIRTSEDRVEAVA